MIGETSALAPLLAEFGQKAELGAVSFDAVVVVQLAVAPLTTAEVQPAGSTGEDTASKFCVNVCAGIALPRDSTNVAEPS